MAASKRNTADAIQLLTADHRSVEQLFKAFEKAEKEDDMEMMEQVITTACAALQAHSKIEEEIFYPAVRAEAGDDEELMDQLNEADVEHGAVDALVERLTTQKLDDDRYKANFTVVMEYVKHHVKEEEKEMFPKVRKLKGLDLQALGLKLSKRRQELMEELTGEQLPSADETISDDDTFMTRTQSQRIGAIARR